MRFFSRVLALLALLATTGPLGAGIAERTPLRTEGRYIVDKFGQSFRLKSVNWYGSHMEAEVPQGLDRQPVSRIIQHIKDWGFNSVRLPYSNQMLHNSQAVEARHLAANPQWQGLSPIQVMDEIVKLLTANDIAVILNNHTTRSEWCCNFDANGLWHNSGGGYEQSTVQWEDDWMLVIERYKHNPLVIGADLRNEVRTAKWRETFLPQMPNWGNGDGQDWHLAANRIGNRILKVHPDILIIVEGINWTGSVPNLMSGSRPTLSPVRTRPINLSHPEKLVYAAHNYSFTGPRHTGDSMTSPGMQRYGEMDDPSLRNVMEYEFGYLLTPDQYYTAPVWLSEFGIGHGEGDLGNRAWFDTVTAYLKEKEMDYAYWPLNAEGYGLVHDDWNGIRNDDWRAPYMHRITGPNSDFIVPRQDRWRRAWVIDRDENLGTRDEDWMSYTYKATCGDDERLQGLSQDHRALCFAQMREPTVSRHQATRAVGPNESEWGQRGTGDWASGSTKYECPNGFVANGYAKSRWGAQGLLCAQSLKVVGNSCRTLDITGGDARMSMRSGDWAEGSHKGQCGDDEALVGYAHRRGSVTTLLCCR